MSDDIIRFLLSECMSSGRAPLYFARDAVGAMAVWISTFALQAVVRGTSDMHFFLHCPYMMQIRAVDSRFLNMLGRNIVVRSTFEIQ